MELRKLAHIVALADEANFGRAAERVHLSQPAFSRSIQAAEAELGLKLFDRGTLEATCTPGGAFVVERARRVLQENRRMEREVGLFRAREIGDIAFGCGPFPAATLIPPLMTELRNRHPGVTVRIQVGNPRHLLEPVRREETDFFVADTRQVPRDGVFRVMSIGQQRGGFFVREGHPLLSKKKLVTADIAPYGLATGRLPAEVHAFMLRIMGLAEDAQLPVAVECDDVHLLKCVALSTDTVMIGMDDIVSEELAAGKIRPLKPGDFPPTRSELGIVSLEGRSHSPVAEYAIKVLAALARGKPPPAG